MMKDYKEVKAAPLLLKILPTCLHLFIILILQENVGIVP